MEIGITLLVLIAVLVFFFRSQSTESSSKGPYPETELPPIKTRPKPVRKAFEAKSAIPQKGDTVLRGSAYVVDGDTIVIRKTQIRLFGIDAPEIDHPFGKKAKWALVALCKGQTVQAEISEKDAYGRAVAKCYLPDGRDLSAEMVKIGLALDWPKFSSGKYRLMEVPGIRKKLWLADARQKGRMHVWQQFETKKKARTGKQKSE